MAVSQMCTCAVLLCKMEENKTNWNEMINKIAFKGFRQRDLVQLWVKNSPNKEKPVKSRCYQRGMCSQKSDHENTGQVYLQKNTFKGKKIASPSRQVPQPAGTTKWATTLKFGKILGTPSVVRSIQNPQNVVRCRTHMP